ncbi:MAG: tRNA (adenosine(37)-N6)-threonylcarbamoyltransferase complex dimerization subunit type 1 TsaB [Gammaproteobacteria bacterium]|nr:MAG: tRNA (adenosine(37)-N6)-threonylcarbamoyltransferase complex dimerization subunit type 1 TsaB [Gammaproteobacteria bacterium]PCH64179.1 MAG: tRNA (adenosine(37)-N6)-threonylcarbamoyltransferase complex dimerization subunit type 1 TsaB [Gammaproteobacteria bacterium]
MSRILSINSASDFCSVTIFDAAGITTRSAPTERGHGDAVLEMVDQVLKETGYSKNSIDALAFACGPGAFTSLRIGAGITQGLAVGIDRPIVPVSSLAALAHGVYRNYQRQQTLVAIDARMDQVYFAAYETSALGESKLLSEVRVCDPAELVWASGPWATVGVGWEIYADEIKADEALKYVGVGAEDCAIDVAYLAQKVVNEGKALSAEFALPVYVRDRVVHRAS